MPEPIENIRLRFAPSPTGFLHPGGARTALFNYLFARHSGGEVLLRIEDTDRARSEARYEESLLEDLAWLGLTFDGEPTRQSERDRIYERYLRRLGELGLTYEAEDEAGRRAAYFRPPTRGGAFRDKLRGEVSFSRTEDFVLMKSDGTPSYNFACVADDLELDITTIIRGEEHIPNTTRQVLLYRALGEPEPEFVHLGVILGPDGKKLSKRHGGSSLRDYRDAGYLPEAVVNHLALLGWNHPEGREYFASIEELRDEWTPSRLGASPATFDAERLRSLNAEHLRSLPTDELRIRLAPFMDEPLPEGREPVAVEMLREDLQTLADAPNLLSSITGPVEPERFLGELPEASAKVFDHVHEAMSEEDFAMLDAARGFLKGLRAWGKSEGIRVRDLLHPLRLALTGHDSGPEMAYLLVVLGAEESRRRVEAARRGMSNGLSSGS
ncbi:MAG: glutamate--tRNA ligase [Rubrobacter sp.]